MDTRVKERLVGAAVLVGIIVAFVPEMLSGPRHENSAPASSDQVRTYTIDLSRGADASGPPREVVPAEAPAADPAPAPETGATTPASEQETQSTSVDSTAASSSNEPPATPAAPAAREAATVDSGWAVQLGSFANRENAERLAQALRKDGYRAFVSRSGSGASTRHRVRVGPEQVRSNAEALAQRLRREGRDVSIVSHP